MVYWCFSTNISEIITGFLELLAKCDWWNITSPMSVETSQFTCLLSACSTVCPGWHKKKHQSPTLLVLCDTCRNPPVTGGFLSQRASNAERVSMSWCCNDQSGYTETERLSLWHPIVIDGVESFWCQVVCSRPSSRLLVTIRLLWWGNFPFNATEQVW